MRKTNIARVLLALVASVATVVAGATPAFASAPAVAEASTCIHNTITTGDREPGLVIYKADTTCRDMNVTSVLDNSERSMDAYAGFYRTPDGIWIIGSRGYIRMYDGNVKVVLLSNVHPTVPMSIGSLYDGGDIVRILH